MNDSVGHPSALTEQEPPEAHPTQENTSRERGCSPLLLGGAVIGLVLSLVLGVQLFGVVSGLIFPAEPPIPAGMQAEGRENLAYGVDTWVYSSDTLSPCEVMAFYEAENSTCSTTSCAGGAFNNPGYPLDEVGTCVGTGTFSIFGMRWEARISTRYEGDDVLTQLDVQRDVLWSGPAPAATTSAE